VALIESVPCSKEMQSMSSCMILALESTTLWLNSHPATVPVGTVKGIVWFATRHVPLEARTAGSQAFAIFVQMSSASMLFGKSTPAELAKSCGLSEDDEESAEVAQAAAAKTTSAPVPRFIPTVKSYSLVLFSKSHKNGARIILS